MIKPYEGMRFVHSRLRDKSGPSVCEVTFVADTSVYYREVRTGRKRSTDVMCFSGMVERLVSDAEPMIQTNTIDVVFSG